MQGNMTVMLWVYGMCRIVCVGGVAWEYQMPRHAKGFHGTQRYFICKDQYNMNIKGI